MSTCFLYNQCNHKDCDKLCQRKLKLTYLFEESEISDRYWANFDLATDADGTDKPEFARLAAIKAKIVHFVRSGAGLYLHSSNSGNGKTSWAIKLAQAYLDRTWKSQDLTSCAVLFVSVPTFLEAIKHNITAPDAYAERLLAKIPKADLVI